MSQPLSDTLSFLTYCLARNLETQQVVKDHIEQCESFVHAATEQAHAGEGFGHGALFMFPEMKSNPPPTSLGMRKAMLDQRKVSPLLLNKCWSREEDLWLKRIVENRLVGMDTRDGRTIENLDWESVALEMSRAVSGMRHAFPGGVSEVHRTVMCCRIRYLHWLDDGVYRGKWAREEEIALLEAIGKYGGRNWKAIADCVGTRRNAVQCFQRFSRSLAKEGPKSLWCEKADADLIESVCEIGERWLDVALRLSSLGWVFTNDQCRVRYLYSLNCKTGIWTEEEDRLLSTTLEVVGRDWKMVSELVGRHDRACRDRWADKKSSRRARERWSSEEDAALLKAVAKYGAGRWSKISSEVPGRNDNSCWNRWKLLNPDGKADIFEARLAKRRKVLPSNKQKREGAVVGIDDFYLSEAEAEEAVLPLSESGLRGGDSSWNGKRAEVGGETLPLPDNSSPNYDTAGISDSSTLLCAVLENQVKSKALEVTEALDHCLRLAAAGV